MVIITYNKIIFKTCKIVMKEIELIQYLKLNEAIIIDF